MPSCDFDTSAKRSRLRPRRNPYWVGISGGRGGVSLGFRRTVKGEGVWVAKIVIDGRRIEESIGTPDADGTVPGGLSFPSAVEVALGWGRRQTASFVAASELVSVGQIPTVWLAVETYVDMRRARADRSGSEGSLKLHVTNDQEFAGWKLGRLEAQNIVDWRERLPNELEPSSINRILNDLRAALNTAATKYRRQLPAHILAEIKLGTKAVAVTSSPRRQLLTDEQVRAVVTAAFEVDPSGDFGRLVLLAARTGARFSQLANLLIIDFQLDNIRLMMPSSRKGKNRQSRTCYAVPMDIDDMRRILPAIDGRDENEPLLLRWSHRRTGGPGNWTKDKRQAWRRADEIDELWAKTVALAGIPADTVMYALRHSSIVRDLKKNVPVSVVAAMHDTSVGMIEKHYAAFIIDMTEDMVRKTRASVVQAPNLLQAAE